MGAKNYKYSIRTNTKPKRFQNMDSKMRVEGAEYTLLHEHPERPTFSKTHRLKDDGYTFKRHPQMHPHLHH